MPKIAHVTARAWDVPMRAPYRSARRVTTVAHNVLVTVTLDDGAVGYGESAPAAYVTGETQEIVLASVNHAIPLMIGQEAAQTAFPRHGPGMAGALETALIDACARSAGVPAYRYINPDFAGEPERATDLSLPILPPDEAAQRAADAAAQGFRALKLKVGSDNSDEDAARVRAVAQAAPGARLRLDGNQGFTPEGAVSFIEGLADLHERIELLEQPTKAGDASAMRFVAERVPFPVFADESAHDAFSVHHLLQTKSCQGIVLKLAKLGVAGTQAAVQSAQAFGVPCLFGCMMETRIGIGMALHLALALGAEAVPMLDLDGHLLTDDRELLGGGFTQIGDLLHADPNAPGLGVSLR